MIACDVRWSPPPAEVALADGEIHVWCASLDQPAWCVGSLAEWLSPDEATRAGRFCFERDRTRFIVGRGLLRAILGRYVDADPARLRFHYGPRGKPSLAGGHGGGALRFNLAHSDGVALYAVTRGREIGVDVERLRPIPDAEQIAARCFSPRENAVLCGLPAGARLQAFFNCWTRKEAYVKALGDGLAWPLDAFDVPLGPGGAAGSIRLYGAPEVISRWAVRALEPAVGCVGAVAAEGHPWRLACWTWPAGPPVAGKMAMAGAAQTTGGERQ